MPTVTSIKPQRNKRRVNIYLDNKFGFGLDLENFVKLGLKVEQELSEEKVAEIVKKGEFQKTLDKLLKFATLRPRSEKEIKDWFKRKKVHESLHKELFNRLKRLELLDDAQFARWWVGQRSQFKPRGKRALESELRIKRIKKEVIAAVLSEFKIDEVKIAKTLLAKKAHKWQHLPSRDGRQKMAQFLARKGFNWEIIEKVLKK